MAYWHAEKYDTLCQRNFSINGNENSFEFLPQYIKDYITEMTLIMQKPVFEFSNGFVLKQECITANEKFAWRSVMTLGDFVFFDIPDCDFKNIFPACKRFADVLGAFSFIPSSDTDTWLKTLKNGRRRSWRTSKEVIESPKFKKVFDKALEKAIVENNKDIPMIIPSIPDDNIIYKMTDRIKYEIKYSFGLSVKSYKYKTGYFVFKDSTTKPIITFNDIESLNIYLLTELEKDNEAKKISGDGKDVDERQGTNQEISKSKGQETKKKNTNKRNKK